MAAATRTTKANTLRKAGAGALALAVIMHDDKAELARCAAAGDPRSQRLLRTLHEMDEAIAVRPCRAPIQCSTCPTPIRGVPWAAVIAAPGMSTDLAQALSFAICTGCGPTFNDVKVKAGPMLPQVFSGAYAMALGAGGRA